MILPCDRPSSTRSRCGSMLDLSQPERVIRTPSVGNVHVVHGLARCIAIQRPSPSGTTSGFFFSISMPKCWIGFIPVSTSGRRGGKLPGQKTVAHSRPVVEIRSGQAPVVLVAEFQIFQRGVEQHQTRILPELTAFLKVVHVRRIARILKVQSAFAHIKVARVRRHDGRGELGNEYGRSILQHALYEHRIMAPFIVTTVQVSSST